MKSPDSIHNPQWPVRLGPAIRNDLLTSLELLPYRSAFAANDSRFKIGPWARQTGKDHTRMKEFGECRPGALTGLPLAPFWERDRVRFPRNETSRIEPLNAPRELNPERLVSIAFMRHAK